MFRDYLKRWVDGLLEFEQQPIEGQEHHDNANVGEQSFPEFVSENENVDAKDNQDHHSDVNNGMDVIFHSHLPAIQDSFSIRSLST